MSKTVRAHYDAVAIQACDCEDLRILDNVSHTNVNIFDRHFHQQIAKWLIKKLSVVGI